MGLDGGYADYLLAPSARHVLQLGDLDPVNAGPLDDAGLTPYHAIRASHAALGPGSVAVVIGVGRLGHMAVQLLRAVTPATIVAVETDAGRRALAEELGADLVLHPADDAVDRIKALGWDGATFSLDMVGSDDTLALAVGASAPGADVVLVGAALGSFPASLLSLPFECRVRTTLAGEAREAAEVIELAQAGRVRVRAEHVALEDVQAHLALLDEGNGPNGRFIAVVGDDIRAEASRPPS